MLELDAVGDYLDERDLTWEAGTSNGLGGLNHFDVDGAELLAEFAGRVCYDSFGAKQGRKGTDTYLANLLKQGHGSVLEHANFTLLLTGISRTLTHELVRHRAGFSYSQESQRYVDTRDLAFVVPEAIAVLPGGLSTVWLTTLETIVANYALVLEQLQADVPADLSKTEQRKWCRQAARSLLPGCAATTIVVTANARAWRHFLELRGGPGAEPEIRRLALLIYHELHAAAPLLFAGYELGAGHSITGQYRKV